MNGEITRGFLAENSSKFYESLLSIAEENIAPKDKGFRLRSALDNLLSSMNEECLLGIDTKAGGFYTRYFICALSSVYPTMSDDDIVKTEAYTSISHARTHLNNIAHPKDGKEYKLSNFLHDFEAVVHFFQLVSATPMPKKIAYLLTPLPHAAKGCRYPRTHIIYVLELFYDTGNYATGQSLIYATQYSKDAIKKCEMQSSAGGDAIVQTCIYYSRPLNVVDEKVISKEYIDNALNAAVSKAEDLRILGYHPYIVWLPQTGVPSKNSAAVKTLQKDIAERKCTFFPLVAETQKESDMAADLTSLFALDDKHQAIPVKPAKFHNVVKAILQRIWEHPEKKTLQP